MVTDPGFVRGRGVELVVAGDGDSLDAGAEDEVAVVELPGTADVADVAGRVPLPDELEQPASATAAAASATIIGLLREGHMGRERNPPRALPITALTERTTYEASGHKRHERTSKSARFAGPLGV